MALVGEPTNMAVVHAAKGFAGVEIDIPFSVEEKKFRERHDLSAGITTQSRIFVGKAAHSSVPHLGDSAITKLLQYLVKLPSGIAIMEIEGGMSFNTIPAHAVLEIDMVGGLKDTISEKIARIYETITEVERDFETFADPEFVPHGPTMNIGMMRTFQDFIKMGGCVRVPPTVHIDVYQKWIDMLRATCEQLGAVFRVTDYKQPFRTTPGSELISVCENELQKLGLSDQRRTQPLTNEANVFSRFGMECVVIGPGQGVGNSHAPNEFVSLSHLDNATRFYEGVMKRVCL